MNRLIVILIFCGIISSLNAFGQNKSDRKGFSIYKKYDNSFVTQDLKRKHAISFGPMLTTYAPRVIDIIPSAGVHLGYNYLLLNRRRIKMSRKLRYREEIAFGIGLDFNVYTENQYSIIASIYRPFIRTKGRFFSWYFISRYGLGVIRSAATAEEANPIGVNLDIEIFRLRIGKIPFYLHGNFNYAVKNDLLATARLKSGFSVGLRYYFYKNKP